MIVGLMAFVAGAGYAVLFWLAACRIACKRDLALGRWPYEIVALSGAAAVAVAGFFPPEVALLFGATLIGTLLCATVDARTGYIFDVLSVGVATVAGVLALGTGHFIDGIRAAAIVGGAMLALYLGTQRRGIGFGDVKLTAALALGYGLQLSVLALGSAFVIGGGWGAVLIGLGRAKRSDALRFGPFIAAGAFVGLSADALGYRW